MLTEEQRCILSLLRRAFEVGTTADMADMPEGLDSDDVAVLIRKSGILLTVYPVLDGLTELKISLQNEYLANVAQNVNQDYEGRRAIAALDEAGFHCIPLKGWDVRALYPQTTMRQMTDVDILVDGYDYERVAQVMESLGLKPEGDEESIYKHDVYHKGAVTLELHRRISDEVGPRVDWEQAMLSRIAHAEDGWHMSDEDRYLMHFVHMSHDFQNGWFGLRRVVDAWLLDRGRGSLDQEYVDDWLGEMGILKFRERMCRLGRVVMGEEPLDENAGLLLEFAFGTGVYGSATSHKAARIAMMSGSGVVLGSIRSMFAHVFLPRERMLAEFPQLVSRPWLLPVCWAQRIVHIVRGGNLRQYRHMLDYGDLTREDVETMRRVQKAAEL